MSTKHFCQATLVDVFYKYNNAVQQCIIFIHESSRNFMSVTYTIILSLNVITTIEVEKTVPKGLISLVDFND